MRALALILVALAPGVAAAQPAPVITEVRAGGAGGALLLEVVATEPLTYLAVDTPEPFTVTLFVAHATFAFPAAVRELPEGPLRQIAGVVLDRPEGLLARLDFVFERPVGYRISNEGRRLLLMVDAPGVREAVVLGTPPPEPLEPRVSQPPEPLAPAPAPAPPAPLAPPAGTVARVVRITPVESGETVRVAVEAERPLTPRAFTLQDPPRLVVDFDNVVTTLGRFTLAVGGRVLERIRASQFRAVPVPVVRIVLDLRRLVPYRVEPNPRGAVIHLGVP